MFIEPSNVRFICQHLDRIGAHGEVLVSLHATEDENVVVAVTSDNLHRVDTHRVRVIRISISDGGTAQCDIGSVRHVSPVSDHPAAVIYASTVARDYRA